MATMGGKQPLKFAKRLASLVLCPKCDSPNRRLALRVGKNSKEAPYLRVTIRTS